MKLVVDASMALAWLFVRENTEEAECADHLLLELVNADAVVPSLWHTEVANALLVSERRRAVNEAQVIDYLSRLSRLPITTDNKEVASRRDMVMALAREYGLTAYDATYLDLALSTDSVLATFDRKLADAMCRAGGTVFSHA